MTKTQPIPIITIEDHPEGISISRDGDVVLTPKRSVLVLPNHALAEAVAAEFSMNVAQPLGARPLTKIAYTAIDLVEKEYDSLVEALIAYLHTDSICYFAEAPELAKRERMHWQPILDWASNHFACELLSFEGVMPADQPEDAVIAINRYIETLDKWRVAVLLEFTRGLSSLILALAVMESRIDAATAFNCSQVDEDMQREQWGEEQEAMERREKLKNEMLLAEQFLSLL